MCPLRLGLLISSGTERHLRSRDVIAAKPEMSPKWLSQCQGGKRAHTQAEINTCLLAWGGSAGRQVAFLPSPDPVDIVLENEVLTLQAVT